MVDDVKFLRDEVLGFAFDCRDSDKIKDKVIVVIREVLENTELFTPPHRFRFNHNDTPFVS